MLHLDIDHIEELNTVAHALSSEVRVKIIRLLNDRNMSIIELADMLDIPASTVASNIKVLERANLILTELQPATRGAQRICSRNFDDIHIQLNKHISSNLSDQNYKIEMPIGHFVDCMVIPTCGMANEKRLIEREDEPAGFFHPNRVSAQILWLRKGYIEYRFPITLPPNAKIKSIDFSLEICSEAPRYDNDWPSDITVWINHQEIGTWTCPGDFGGRRGKLNPSWWNNDTTQYGILKTWKVDRSNTYIDDVKISGVSLHDLNLMEHRYVSFKIGVKENAIHKGGMNIFGKHFGDHEQDIIMNIHYST